MTERQYFGWAEKESRRDSMKLSERGGELVGVAAIILVALFFYAHQSWATGFFTSSFGSTEAFFLYGSIILGTLAPLVRFAVGRRNDARPPEALASLFWVAGSVWLLVVFPFDFAHFGDVLPDFLRFLVGWITNDIAWVLVLLGTLGGIGSTATSVMLYLKVGRLLLSRRASA